MLTALGYKGMYPLYFMNEENEDTDQCKKKKSPRLQTGIGREERTHILPLLQRLSLVRVQGLSVSVVVTCRPRCDKPVLCLVRHSVLGPYLHIAKRTIKHYRSSCENLKGLQALNVLHATQFLVEKWRWFTDYDGTRILLKMPQGPSS